MAAGARFGKIVGRMFCVDVIDKLKAGIGREWFVCGFDFKGWR